MKTINKIRSKDPDIYDNEKEWFDDDQDGESLKLIDMSPALLD